MDYLAQVITYCVWGLVCAFWCRSLAKLCRKRELWAWGLCGFFFNIIPVIALYAALPSEPDGVD